MRTIVTTLIILLGVSTAISYSHSIYTTSSKHLNLVELKLATKSEAMDNDAHAKKITLTLESWASTKQ